MKKTALAIVLLSVFLLIYSPFCLFAEAELTWNLQKVEDTGRETGSSLAIDSAGNPHVAYCGDRIFGINEDNNAFISDPGLQYASWNSLTWNIQTVVKGNIGNPSLALDSNGNPKVSYVNYYIDEKDVFHRNLMYANWTGTTWNIQTVDTDTEYYCCLALDSSGNPTINYFSSLGDLKCAILEGTTWNIQIVDQAGDNPHISGNSLAVDQNGIQNMIYSNDFGLVYANWTGLSWNAKVVDTNGFGGSLVLDKSGSPNIAYEVDLGNYTFKLNYAKWNGSVWITHIVTENGGQCQIALDNAGNPHIIYRSNGYFVYANRTGSIWNKQQSFGASYPDYTPVASFALDPNGKPHFSVSLKGNYIGHGAYAYYLSYASLQGPAPTPTPTLGQGYRNLENSLVVWVAVGILVLAGLFWVKKKLNKKPKR
jgi:hypothetical protein